MKSLDGSPVWRQCVTKAAGRVAGFQLFRGLGVDGHTHADHDGDLRLEQIGLRCTAQASILGLTLGMVFKTDTPMRDGRTNHAT